MAKLCIIICHLGRVTREFTITVFFSILPILVGAMIASLWSEPSFSSAFIVNFRYGEVFLYTSAFLSPYIYKKALREKKTFASILAFLLAAYSIFAGVFVFSFVRLEDVLSRKMSVSADSLFWTSISIILTTLFVWYYSVWHDHSKRIDPAMEDLRQRDALASDIDAKLGG
ncbi:hypothetical protein HBA43_19935 [Providencia rettgeri]|uniref:hypothetical protein n=1 Tax=Providencia rettgeri TaxID=587 RepID=UPI00141956EC|nr:hypothetical protein [Providencia rettgeri]NIA76490.1 hypothetical protein [Providencia rettgeri]NIA80662.1 hypothetical protein [Providencia rettgeri]NIB03919.1 hypothetical protein [Providencia rettgeri]NIB08094.1 hypothetical protein [Providencia rettgeri]NIB21735.1 hypothetical protein [Providencia rettgeri]